MRKSGLMSPDDETVITPSRVNKRYSKDSNASYDSQEVKDKVSVDGFTPMPYQEDNGNNPFNLDLTNEPENDSKEK